MHRKLKALVGMSATEFLRSVKMKHAAELLKTGKYNISEAMFAVGYDNHSYFAKAFKRQFGKSPGGYLQENNGQGTQAQRTKQ